MVKVKEPEARQALFDDQPDVFFAYGGFTTAFGSVGVRVKKVARRSCMMGDGLTIPERKEQAICHGSTVKTG